MLNSVITMNMAFFIVVVRVTWSCEHRAPDEILGMLGPKKFWMSLRMRQKQISKKYSWQSTTSKKVGEGRHAHLNLSFLVPHNISIILQLATEKHPRACHCIWDNCIILAQKNRNSTTLSVWIVYTYMCV